MGFWLDFLNTPMAAPETRLLQGMRFAILLICALLVALITALGALRAVIGNTAGAMVGGMLLVLGVLVPIYVRRKNRADDAHLDALISGGDQ